MKVQGEIFFFVTWHGIFSVPSEFLVKKQIYLRVIRSTDKIQILSVEKYEYIVWNLAI